MDSPELEEYRRRHRKAYEDRVKQNSSKEIEEKITNDNDEGKKNEEKKILKDDVQPIESDQSSLRNKFKDYFDLIDEEKRIEEEKLSLEEAKRLQSLFDSTLEGVRPADNSYQEQLIFDRGHFDYDNQTKGSFSPLNFFPCSPYNSSNSHYSAYSHSSYDDLIGQQRSYNSSSYCDPSMGSSEANVSKLSDSSRDYGDKSFRNGFDTNQKTLDDSEKNVTSSSTVCSFVQSIKNTFFPSFSSTDDEPVNRVNSQGIAVNDNFDQGGQRAENLLGKDRTNAINVDTNSDAMNNHNDCNFGVDDADDVMLQAAIAQSLNEL